jgi:hypothetical protein
MRIASVAVLLALVAAAPQGKKGIGPGTGIDWQGDWDAALKEAAARNVPIMFGVHKDG